MSFLDDLIARGKAPLSVLQRYRTTVREKKKLALFVEGYEDHEFYGFVVKSLGLESDFYICFGKKKLDETLKEFLDAELPVDGVLFIRDRDFDVARGTVIEAAPLFLTCGYSVENYVFNETSIKEFLLFRCGVSSREVDVEAIASHFTALCAASFLAFRPLHESLFEALSRGRSVDLNSVSFADLAKKLLSGQPVDELMREKIIGLGLEDEASEEVKAVVSAYHEQPPVLGIRGKYLGEICVVFARQCIESLLKKHKQREIQNFNRRVASNISDDSILSVFVPLASPSDRLIGALRSVV